MQIEVVTAKFNGGAHGYSFSPNGFDLKKGDLVIVETEKGKDIVKITKEKHFVDNENIDEPLKNVVKMADADEIAMAKANREKVQSYLPKIKELAKKEKLDMNVISVECTYNLSRLTINFMAEERVDFRELVKKLAETYKTRIELRQIGPRDRARIIGGLGPCGKECCCAQGFGINDHVSIKMAKEQSASLNPSKISGNCGRLMCCLKYEQEVYEEKLKRLPKVGAIVKTEDGEGEVCGVETLKEIVKVKFHDGEDTFFKKYNSKDIKIIKNAEKEDDSIETDNPEDLKELQELEKLEKLDERTKSDDDDI